MADGLLGSGQKIFDWFTFLRDAGPAVRAGIKPKFDDLDEHKGLHLGCVVFFLTSV